MGNAPAQPEARPVIGRLRRGQVIVGVLLLALITVVVLAAFGPPLWQLIGSGTLLLPFVVVVLLALGVLLITLLIAAITRKRTRIMPWLGRLGRLFLVLVMLIVAMAGAVVGSQWHASTPPILGADGKPLPGSIATMEQVTLNGSQQWITICGKNIHYMGEQSFVLLLPLALQFTSEYGLLDRVNWVRGLYESFTVVWPQLKNLDFTTQAARLDVPVYFLEGRHDVNAMAPLAERYYHVLQAPHKELIWLEQSGHETSEADWNKFVDVMVNRVLPQTYHE